MQPATSNATEQPTRVDEAYAGLKAQILDNRLPPGFQAFEAELAERLGMSRTPVREALLRLAREGLVEVTPRRGMRVLPVSAEDMREIYALLMSLEADAAAALAGTRPGAAVLAPLEAATKEMEHACAVGDLECWAGADDRFHRELIALSGNRRLIAFVNGLYDQAHRARMVTLRLREAPERSTAEHREILRAIAAGDEEAVRERFRAHRARATSELLEILERHHLHQL